MSDQPKVDYDAARRLADQCIEQYSLLMAAVNASSPNPRSCYRGPETASVVAAYVAEWFKIPLSELKRAGRENDKTWARQVAMFFMREFTSATLMDVAKLFRRNHGCVVNAIKTVQARCHTEPRTALDIANLRSHITIKLK